MAELAPGLPRKVGYGSNSSAFLQLCPASALSTTARTVLYDLWEQNIGPLVQGTSFSDDEATKRAEMFHPDMRFLLMLNTSPTTAAIAHGDDKDQPCIAGPAEDSSANTTAARSSKKKRKKAKVNFDEKDLMAYCSLRFDTEQTLDDDRDAEVVYCYELQLIDDTRGRGIGRMLMQELEGLGRSRGMEKAMLTCMKSNTSALQFYEKIGYTADEIDPTRMLSSQASKFDYVILSKNLAG